MDNLLMTVFTYLFDNKILPIQFSASVSMAILGVMALSNSEKEDTLHSIGWLLIGLAGLGNFLTAINLMG